MCKLSFASLLLFTTILFAATANAQKERFGGFYVSEDPDTRGITRLEIYEDDAINVWGRCHPADCDWGTEAVVAYAPTVDADPQRTARALTATYIHSHAVTVLVIKLLKDGRLRVDVFTRFTDGSGRSPYTRKEILIREGRVE